ncbi:hypothetical protein R1sor_001019 [Riccia sorocarpa]|uniref:Uncharacterized protein n=1 Tax=Riccia sorocarpa TaxID=122646 RepID=A0ABD3GUR8_9MARC
MTTAREEAASHIRAWCTEKGTEAFEEQTYGDPRYFAGLHDAIKQLWPDDKQLSTASFVKSKKRCPESSQLSVEEEKPATCTTVSQFTVRGRDNLPVTCELETTTCIQVLSDETLAIDRRKRRRLPQWMLVPRPGNSVSPDRESTTDGDSESDAGSAYDSPRRAPRKTRILSSSSQQNTECSSPLDSPIRICLRVSSQKDLQERCQFSLRNQRRQARLSGARDRPSDSALPPRISCLVTPVSQPHENLGGPNASDVGLSFSAALPVLDPAPVTTSLPPASKHKAKTRSAQGVSTSKRPLFTFDDSNAPIISAPCGDVILAPPYVTRSLFRESLLSNNSPSVITNSTSAVVNAVHDICVIGVSTDVFSDEQLVGSNPCFDEFICC